MTSGDIDTIERLSQPFSKVLESLVRDFGDDARFRTDGIPLSMKAGPFPNGACRFSSIIFGLLLRRQDIDTTLIESWQCTTCNECTNEHCDGRREHAWLEHYGWIIDLTRCQFDDFPEKPFLASESDWHASWKIVSKKELASFEDRQELIDEIAQRLGLEAVED